MPTMTTEEIATATSAKRARARELTAQKEKLQKSHAGATDTVARAIAAGRGGEAVAARKVVRTAADEIAEIDSAIELLLQETAQLERDRKAAEKREAVTRAEKSAIEASTAMSALLAGLRDAAGKMRILKARADSAMMTANRDDANVKALDGQPSGMFPRFHFHNSPGVLELVNSLVTLA